MRVESHGVLLGGKLILEYDFSRQRIDINAPIPQNLNAIVAIHNRLIGPGLQGAWLSWLQSVYEFLG